MEEMFNLILIELKKLNERVTNLENNVATKTELNEMRAEMATKDDIADIELIKQAVLETNLDVKKVLEDQKSIFEILGEHEVSIRTLKRRPV